MDGPQNTFSSRVTPLYTETLFCLLQFFSNGHIRVHNHILPDITPLTNPGVFQKMGKMPDLCILTNLHPFIDFSRVLKGVRPALLLLIINLFDKKKYSEIS
jgi:hypothetical protein